MDAESGAGISRERARELLGQHLKNRNLVNHCLASEAIMRSLARRLDGDPELWGITGLLHDLDLEMISADPMRHALTAAAMLREEGLAPAACTAIERHNAEALGLARSEQLDFALASAETITGLIVATALVMPDRKLASVKPKSVRKRFKDKRFAAGASREIIIECEKLDLSLDQFIELSLEAMCEIADEIGL
ncbi:MAG: HDIG domain-containing protein [Candidatus Alcyoniella australis]|nr:HDIG domain-containing protein [Candidatus Alcyoniella australis]